MPEARFYDLAVNYDARVRGMGYTFLVQLPPASRMSKARFTSPSTESRVCMHTPLSVNPMSASMLSWLANRDSGGGRNGFGGTRGPRSNCPGGTYFSAKTSLSSPDGAYDSTVSVSAHTRPPCTSRICCRLTWMKGSSVPLNVTTVSFFLQMTR